MKNKQLSDLYQAIDSTKNLKGIKFSFAMVKNKKLIEAELKAFEESCPVSDKYKEYDAKRVELGKEHAKKNENGEPVINGRQFVIEDMKEFEKVIKKLQTTYKEALDERDKQNEELEKLMNDDTKIELHKVRQEDIPEDITQEQLEGIFDLIQ